MRTLNTSKTQNWILRLTPGVDLKKTLIEHCLQNKIEAAALMTCVGSLTQGALRYASAQDTTLLKGPLEILSLAGTLCQRGVHLHASFADAKGAVFGGHLMEGNLIYTTAEIVILEYLDLCFTRKPDPQTGFLELFLSKKSSNPV